MNSNENDGRDVSKATQPLLALRETLHDLRGSNDAERIHLALLDVVDGLITHAQKQARAIDDLRSDMLHKQGIVTSIESGKPAPKSVRPLE